MMRQEVYASIIRSRTAVLDHVRVLVPALVTDSRHREATAHGWYPGTADFSVKVPHCLPVFTSAEHRDGARSCLHMSVVTETDTRLPRRWRGFC